MAVFITPVYKTIKLISWASGSHCWLQGPPQVALEEVPWAPNQDRDNFYS